MVYLGKNPIPVVNVVFIGKNEQHKKRFNYAAIENVMNNCGHQCILEGQKVDIDYCNCRGDIKVKFLNWRTCEVEKAFILRYYPDREQFWDYNTTR